MSIRTTLGNTLISTGRKVAQKRGECELAVELSDHSIQVAMVDVDETTHAWDPNLYRSGNVFLKGYANPIKPTAIHQKELSDPDTVDINEGDTDTQQEGEDKHVSIMSSNRYQEYMRQDLISQLLNPRQQWRIIAYAVIALAIMMFVNIVISLVNAGVLQ